MMVTTGAREHQVLLLLGEFDFPRGFFFVAERVGGGAEVARQISSASFTSRALVDGGEDLAIDQLLDDETRS